MILFLTENASFFIFPHPIERKKLYHTNVFDVLNTNLMLIFHRLLLLSYQWRISTDYVAWLHI